MNKAAIPSPDEVVRKAAQRLADAETRLRSVLGQVDATAVFATYSLYRLAAMQKDAPDKHARPAPAAVELAAWLLYPEFGRSKVRDGERIQAAITALEEYESAFTFAEVLVDEPYDELATHLRVHSAMVRGSAYPIQIVRRIECVLRPFESELSAMVGIGPWRASEILKALGAQMEENINGMIDAIRDTYGRYKRLTARGEAMTESERTQLVGTGEELRQILAVMESDWVPTKEQVSTRLRGLSEAEWASLTAAVGLTPTSRATLTRVVDVQDRPMFCLDADRAFCLHGVLCFDAIFTFFDDLARNDASLRDRYGQRIAEWMELEIERQMKRLFPAATVVRSACFPDPDNLGGETEADVVVVWGPFLIVAEAKGKRIAREALRGSRGKLKRVLSDNIQDAFIQSRRVLQVLERDGRIRFKEKATGRLVDMEQDRLRRVMPISVTLQHLSGIATQLAVTQRLGLFKGNAYPWSVSIDDLDVITRFAGSPDVFLHYIERRLAHQESQVGIHGDELDIFGQYLNNRLDPSHYEGHKDIKGHPDTNKVFLIGGDEAFDPFYLAEWNGETPPSSVAELKVPPEIRSVLGALRNLSDDGARWIGFALLGLSHAALERLAAALKKAQIIPAKNQRILRITMREDDVVINVLAHRGFTASEFFRIVTIRSRMEHYRAKPRATITLGIDQRDVSKPFEVAQWVEGPWEYDPDMEQLLAKDRETPRIVQMLRSAKKPGPNDPCLCGSGKKFKRCCIDRMTFKRAG